MKVQLFKKCRVILPIILVMVLATAGLIGIASGANAAAKATTYTVTLGEGSAQDSTSGYGGTTAKMDVPGDMKGSFQMIVDAKGKVVIPKKTFKITQVMGGAAKGYTSDMTLKKDVKGQIGKGANLAGVLSKAMKIKASNDKTKGSLYVIFDLVSVAKDPSGTTVATVNNTMYFTTGKATITAKGTKASPLEGVTKSGTGKPIDLDAGTGTLVGIGGNVALKSTDKQSAGQTTDNLSLMTLVMKISK
jgi:hypothetical protein